MDRNVYGYLKLLMNKSATARFYSWYHWYHWYHWYISWRLVGTDKWPSDGWQLWHGAINLFKRITVFCQPSYTGLTTALNSLLLRFLVLILIIVVLVIVILIIFFICNLVVLGFGPTLITPLLCPWCPTLFLRVCGAKVLVVEIQVPLLKRRQPRWMAVERMVDATSWAGSFWALDGECIRCA